MTIPSKKYSHLYDNHSVSMYRLGGDWLIAETASSLVYVVLTRHKFDISIGRNTSLKVIVDCHRSSVHVCIIITTVYMKLKRALLGIRNRHIKYNYG